MSVIRYLYPKLTLELCRSIMSVSDRIASQEGKVDQRLARADGILVSVTQSTRSTYIPDPGSGKGTQAALL